MIDAEGYPKAFLELKQMKLLFTDAKKEKGYVTAKVKFEINREDNKKKKYN